MESRFHRVSRILALPTKTRRTATQEARSAFRAGLESLDRKERPSKKVESPIVYRTSATNWERESYFGARCMNEWESRTPVVPRPVAVTTKPAIKAPFAV